MSPMPTALATAPELRRAPCAPELGAGVGGLSWP